MRRIFLFLLLGIFSAATISAQQKLSVHWEELTADDFHHAIELSKGACILPIGILEKHGPHLPLGTDLLNVRYASLHAAEKEFAVVFPEYYFGQIFEAKHEPGTVAYSIELQLRLLQETTDEMARNGCKKIIIVNGHGGNESLLPFFAQSQLEKPHDYVVYVQWGANKEPHNPLKKDSLDMHAGQSETSNTMISRPDLVHVDRAGQAQARFVVVGLDRPALGEVDVPRLVRDAGDLERLDAEKSGSCYLLGRRQVLLHERRRHGQRAGDVIEPVARDVRRELIGRPEGHA